MRNEWKYGFPQRRDCARLKLSKTVLIWFCISISGAAYADTGAADAAALRAAFVYNISKLVEWPASAFASADAPFVICTLGVSATNIDAMKPLETRSYMGHAIVVTSINSLTDAHACHILYVNDHGALTSGHIAQALDESPVLTISDEHGAADSGAAMEFVTVNGRLRWVMNLTATQNARLKISSKLIEIAASVIGGQS